MQKRRILISFMLIMSLMLTFGLTGCGSSNEEASSSSGEQQTEGKAEIQMITIGTATVGGAWYSMGGGLANVLSKNMPNLKATSTQSGASIENMNAIKNGTMEIGFATSDIPYLMYNGKGYEKNDKIRTLAMNDLIYMALIVKEDSPIKKFEDIKGKTLGTGVAGSSNYVIVEEILKAHGMSYDDVKPYPAGVTQMAEALKDDNCDMFAYVVAGTGGAAPGIVDLSTTTDIRFIPLDEAVLDKINSTMPYYLKETIPAGWVEDLKEPVTALAVATSICCSADLSEELVYEMCKTVFDYKDELDAIHPQWGTTTKDTVAKAIPAPLHPGAEKYYKEIGAPITEL